MTDSYATFGGGVLHDYQINPPITLLKLDTSILYWVLLPITFVMLVASITAVFFNQSTSTKNMITSRHLIKHQSVLNLAKSFRAHYLLLTPHVFRVYLTHLNHSVDFGVSEEASKRRKLAYEADEAKNQRKRDNDDNDDNDESDNNNNNNNNQTNEQISTQDPQDESDNDQSNSQSEEDTKTIPKSRKVTQKKGQKNQGGTQKSKNNKQQGEDKMNEKTPKSDHNDTNDPTSPLQTTTPHPESQYYNDMDPDDVDEELIDPNSMINGMLGSVMGVFPQMIQFVWISYFFTGYLVAKLPIKDFTTLPSNLKAMFHHSIPTSISTVLPVVYISSISWYIINLLGLSSLKTFILENFLTIGLHSSLRKDIIRDSDNDTDVMYQQTIGMSLPQQDSSFHQLNPMSMLLGTSVNSIDPMQFESDYKTQRNELKLIQYNSDTLIYSQKCLLEEWRKDKNK